MTININDLFQIADQEQASDLHLVVNKPPILRISGVLKEITNQPILQNKDIESMVFSLLNEEQKNKLLTTRELDLSHQNKQTRFRINLFWEKGNLALAARIIPQKIPALENLAMPPIVNELIKLRQGLILVTGPTGCGKSTTLASMINAINLNRKENIITLEDPIEFIYPEGKSIVAQRELEKDTLSFTQALKHIVRQDPNIIMVGEMRDLETIATTITLAETGHLVFGTLHTLNSYQTIDRIIDVFPPRQQNQIRLQLTLSLRAVFSQLLLPKIGGGRVAAREILVNNPAIANLIRENKINQIKSIIEIGGQQGMQTMGKDIKRLVKEKIISQETANIYLPQLD